MEFTQVYKTVIIPALDISSKTNPNPNDVILLEYQKYHVIDSMWHIVKKNI